MIISIFLLYKKRNRIIYEIVIDDENQNIEIIFSQFLFKIFRYKINLSDLSFRYKKRLFNKTALITFEFYENNKFIAEFFEKHGFLFGWQVETMNEMVEILRDLGIKEKGKKYKSVLNKT